MFNILELNERLIRLDNCVDIKVDWLIEGVSANKEG